MLKVNQKSQCLLIKEEMQKQIQDYPQFFQPSNLSISHLNHNNIPFHRQIKSRGSKHLKNNKPDSQSKYYKTIKQSPINFQKGYNSKLKKKSLLMANKNNKINLSYNQVGFSGYPDNVLLIQPIKSALQRDIKLRNYSRFTQDQQQLDFQSKKSTHKHQQQSTPNNIGLIGSMTINIKANRRIVSAAGHLAKDYVKSVHKKDNQQRNSYSSNQKENSKIKKNAEVSNHLSFANATNEGNKFTPTINQPTFIDSLNNYYISVKNAKNAVRKSSEGSRYSAKRKKNSLKSSNSFNDAYSQQPENKYNFKPDFFNVVGLRPAQLIKNFDRINTSDQIQDNRTHLKNRKTVFSALGQRNSVKNYFHLEKQKVVNFVDSFCFGKITDLLSSQQVIRLKILYYKDLIWKVSFNQGIIFKVQYDSRYFPKYSVGAGNNSRLIKAIMSKRWWWSFDSRQQNSNFVWTQLKSYSIYNSQQKYDPVPMTEIQINKEINQQQSKDVIQNIESPHQNQHSLSKKKINRTKIKLNTDKSSYIMASNQYNKWLKYITKPLNLKKQKKSNELFTQRVQLQKKLTLKQKFTKKVSNHLQFSKMIGNKKALYKVMMKYEAQIRKTNNDFSLGYIPLTYHITKGLQDPQYAKFLQQYYKKSKQGNKNFWIVKPGQLSNRGNGITVCSNLNEIKYIVKQKQTHGNGTPKSFIVQQYIIKPFLYKGRKFDIRHYIMITCFQGSIRGYYYQQGYIRTTSFKYTLDQNSHYIHLTNDAVQKWCKDYGKFQKGNKLSYEQFEKYLKETYQQKYSFLNQILPKIRKICIDVIKASYDVIDPHRRMNNFQIFGLDIMIDQDFKPWLIQVNTNPCLQLSSPVLAKIIPRMLDNAFTIGLDPQFPPPNDLINSAKRINYPDNFVEYNKFQLVFDEKQYSKQMKSKKKESQREQFNYKQIRDDDEAFQSNDDEYDAEY